MNMYYVCVCVCDGEGGFAAFYSFYRAFTVPDVMAVIVGCLTNETYLTYPRNGQHVCFVFGSSPVYIWIRGSDLPTSFTMFLLPTDK